MTSVAGQLAKLSAIRRAVRSSTAAALALETRHHEGRPAHELREQLVPRVRELGQRTVDVLSELLDEVGEPREGAANVSPATEVLARAADLSFMGRWELSRKLRELASVDDEDDAWALIAVSASTRRRIVKIGTAVDGLLAQATGEEAALEDHDREELARSLVVRRRYMELRATLRDTLTAEGLSDERRVRLVAVNLAKLVGAEIYEDFRIADRKMFRDLQHRILVWLRAVRAGEHGSTEGGRQLLGDVLAFVELLARVNDRAELREHDRGRIEHALGMEAPSVRELGVELNALRGRDDELDELLRLGERADPAAMRPCLERLRITLGGVDSSAVPEVDDTVEIFVELN
jgi:hypothetical protein